MAEGAKGRHKQRAAEDPGYVIAARKRAAKWAQTNPERYRDNQSRYRNQNHEELREYTKRWRQENRDAIKQSRAEARRQDPEKQKAIRKKRYENPEYVDKCRARSRQWRKENPERYAAKNKQWREANPEAVKAITLAGWANRRAKMRTAGRLSAKDIKEVRSRQKCAACSEIHPKMEIDHIVAISRNGRNHISNLQLLCRPCNRSKWAKDFETWMKERSLLDRVVL